ncbi:MAG TPA: hypothetical protein VMX56_07340 [Anaerolineales bacterium]|nr:hypothetical protein [Anaerolineales bacterium]
MKYQTSDVKPLATKTIDITEYFTNPGEVVKLEIRHYSHYEANEINALLLQGQSFKRRAAGKDEDEDEGGDEVSVTKFHIAEAFLARMKAGVVVNENCPFAHWDDEFIRELDRLNPDLTGFINDEIVGYNRPLQKKKGKSSRG